jgi:hypothetical protein
MVCCPECGSLDVDWDENTRESDKWTSVTDYVCNECGCEWTETDSIKITKPAEQEAPNSAEVGLHSREEEIETFGEVEDEGFGYD